MELFSKIVEVLEAGVIVWLVIEVIRLKKLK